MIYLDSWIFCEFFLKDKEWLKCRQLIESKQTKVISTIVLMELKYKMSKVLGKKETRRMLNKLKANKSVSIIDVDERIAEKAANLRLKYYEKGKRELSYSDVIHLATAILSKCKVFYSGDPDFRGIKEIKTVIV